MLYAPHIFPTRLTESGVKSESGKEKYAIHPHIFPTPLISLVTCSKFMKNNKVLTLVKVLL